MSRPGSVCICDYLVLRYDYYRVGVKRRAWRRGRGWGMTRRAAESTCAGMAVGEVCQADVFVLFVFFVPVELCVALVVMLWGSLGFSCAVWVYVGVGG